MKILVLGLGISGKSATSFLEKLGHTVVGVDDRIAPCFDMELDGFDLFVPSPGIARSHPLYRRAKAAGIPVAGEAQLALEAATQPCIGITGTNGKTSVVKMIAHVLNLAGKRARAVGNVGDPLTQYVGQGDEILVVELSSYQLETLSAKVFDVGAILNIAEDHLDRYVSFEEYAKTKAHLEECIKENGDFFVHSSVFKDLFSHPFKEWEGDNEEVVISICDHFGIGREFCLEALSSFKKPAHRLEFVGTVKGVSYFNDSKATNVAAVVKALRMMDDKVVLILGGQDKGLSFAPISAMHKKISSVVICGEAREKIGNALKHLPNVHQAKTLQEAVEKAAFFAKSGGTVLFSPGCASFDAFKNYAERGETFKQLIKEQA